MHSDSDDFLRSITYRHLVTAILQKAWLMGT